MGQQDTPFKTMMVPEETDSPPEEREPPRDRRAYRTMMVPEETDTTPPQSDKKPPGQSSPFGHR